MLIGPNDPSQVLETKFIEAYVALMEQLASNYAYATTPPKVISVCGGSINGLDPCDNIQKAIDSFNRLVPTVWVARVRYETHPDLTSAQPTTTTTITTTTTTSTTTTAEITSDRTDGFEGSYVSIDSDDWSTINKEKNGYLGCDDHYAPNGHAVLEGDIVDGVKTVMGW